MTYQQGSKPRSSGVSGPYASGPQPQEALKVRPISCLPASLILAEPFRGLMIQGYVGKPALEDLTRNAFAREDKNLEPKDVKKL
jgi:hypothetical protein